MPNLLVVQTSPRGASSVSRRSNDVGCQPRRNPQLTIRHDDVRPVVVRRPHDTARSTPRPRPDRNGGSARSCGTEFGAPRPIVGRTARPPRDASPHRRGRVVPSPSSRSPCRTNGHRPRPGGQTLIAASPNHHSAWWRWDRPDQGLRRVLGGSVHIGTWRPDGPPVRTTQKARKRIVSGPSKWWRGQDLNLRPSGCETSSGASRRP